MFLLYIIIVINPLQLLAQYYFVEHFQKKSTIKTYYCKYFTYMVCFFICWTLSKNVRVLYPTYFYYYVNPYIIKFEIFKVGVFCLINIYKIYCVINWFPNMLVWLAIMTMITSLIHLLGKFSDWYWWKCYEFNLFKPLLLKQTLFQIWKDLLIMLSLNVQSKRTIRRSYLEDILPLYTVD